ncbi:histidine kinase [Microvirga flavescens]|uniref:sensor histidine kinase n=1 Tax=Microvirga flavescens TaxID=2249811 RepID=UPI000DD861AF
MTEAAIPQERARRLKTVLNAEAILAPSEFVPARTVSPPAPGHAENAIRRCVMDAVSEERRRISLELHDSTLQHLASVSLSFAQLRSLIDVTPDLNHLLTEVSHSIDAAAREIRAFSYLLHPPHIERLDLDGAIRDFTNGFKRRTDITVSLDFKGDFDRVPGELRIAIFRIVQEAFMNVYRHAHATAVSLSLAVREHAVHLHISDNGRGLAKDDTGKIALGVGIPGMQERVRHAGGVFEIGSGESGTHINATLPIE